MMGKSETMYLQLDYIFNMLVVERMHEKNKIREALIVSIMEEIRERILNGSTHMVLTIEVD